MSEDAIPQSLSEYLYYTLSNLHPNARICLLYTSASGYASAITGKPTPRPCSFSSISTRSMSSRSGMQS